MPRQRFVYITKYALTDGVRRCPVDHPLGTSIVVEWPGGLNGTAIFGKGHYHDEEADAVAAVRKMIAAKRKSLAKALKKLDEQEAALAKGLPMAKESSRG